MDHLKMDSEIYATRSNCLLQHQISMKCDWNTTGFCVTPIPYNHTYFPWNYVKKHLLNHGNMTQEILELHQHITDSFQKQLQVLSGSNLLERFADGISNPDIIKHLKNFGGAMATLTIIVYLCFA